MTASVNKHIFAVLIAVLLVGLAILLYKSPPAEWDSARRFAEFVESQGWLGLFIFFITAVLVTSVGLPRQFFAFAGGFAFGVPMGVFVSSLAAIGGCAITFYFSRRWLSAQVYKRHPNIVKTLNDLVENDVFLKILVMRLQPLGTNLITNVCAGVSSIPAKLFLASSWLGYLPQMMIFSLLGAGIRIGSNTYLLFSVSLLALSLLIGGVLYQRYLREMR